MTSYKLGSGLGKLLTYDHEKVAYVGNTDLSGKTILEFIRETDEDRMCTVSWLAVLNGATKVYVFVPNTEIKKVVDFAKYMNTPSIGHKKITVLTNLDDLPRIDYDQVYDPPGAWKGKAEETKFFESRSLGFVEAYTYLSLLDFPLELKSDPKIAKIKDGASLMTNCVKKAVLAVYKGAEVHLKVKDNFKSTHNFISYYLPLSLVSKIRVVADF